jgi:DNA-binding NarL/FixJ family response regulator
MVRSARSLARRTIDRMPDPESRFAQPLRVLVVDADDRVRESLAGLLAIGGRVVVVGSAGQAGTALELMARTAPDVVLVDPRLPEVDVGTALIARLRVVSPGIRVLAMGWSDTLEHAALESGADGFVRKTFRPNDLVGAVLAAGQRPDAA